jgi:hypothetical protein
VRFQPLLGVVEAITKAVAIPATGAVGEGAKVGWAFAADGAADRRARIAGGSLVAACILGAVACAVLLANVT